MPGARFHAIEVKPLAEVLQISNLTMSDSALLDATKGAKLRADVRAVVAAEVARHPNAKVLAVGTRRVLSAIHEDLNMPESFTLENGGGMMGAEWRWFGPKMQGLNTFEDFDAVVIIGRLQLPLLAVEDRARAIFGDDTGELMTPYTDGALPSATRDRLMADGSLCPASGRDHPDPRVQSILAQASKWSIR